MEDVKDEFVFFPICSFSDGSAIPKVVKLIIFTSYLLFFLGALHLGVRSFSDCNTLKTGSRSFILHP